MKFSEALSDSDLIRVLTDIARGLQDTSNGNVKYVYHYTNQKAAIGIMKSKRWYFGSPKDMNDGLELLHLEEAEISNLFFGSFLSEQEESIAMWSMYSQPWENGVVIRFPIEKMKKWVKAGAPIYKADPKTKKPLDLLDNAKVDFHFVAYTNSEKNKDKANDLLICGQQENSNFRGIITHKSLAGYLKDIAWSYEKELRVRVSVESATEVKAVTMEIPDDIADSFEFITGPRFTGNLLAEMRKEVDKKFRDDRITPSLFTGRLNWVYCDACRAV